MKETERKKRDSRNDDVIDKLYGGYCLMVLTAVVGGGGGGGGVRCV